MTNKEAIENDLMCRLCSVAVVAHELLIQHLRLL
ncbi:hypothetical protein Cylst_6449 (plasmid) [Cylindrospermum stagnale PCC 7417]|uniref:Uncharacterized protein n=1 Tax=Cylindrospermum stagnale PCC 7417 TaxID=56107 RepID=K9X6F0_9NOST|nr:hypothetical protein Cylst_6449 [Cylindrospermum stagnale PCC 7417]